jgi:hypothetical protein
MQQARSEGYNAAVYDMTMDGSTREAHDLLSTRGFILALQLVRRVKRGGLIMAGPPCSSWVFMNRATSCRSWVNPLGDRTSLRIEDVLNLQHIGFVTKFPDAIMKNICSSSPYSSCDLLTACDSLAFESFLHPLSWIFEALRKRTHW